MYQDFMLVKLLCNIANDVVFTRDKSIVSVSVTIDCPYQRCDSSTSTKRLNDCQLQHTAVLQRMQYCNVCVLQCSTAVYEVSQDTKCYYFQHCTILQCIYPLQYCSVRSILRYQAIILLYIQMLQCFNTENPIVLLTFKCCSVFNTENIITTFQLSTLKRNPRGIVG